MPVPPAIEWSGDAGARRFSRERAARGAQVSGLPKDSGMRILIVEDEQKLAEILLRSLREPEGFIVDAAATADEGFHLAISDHYDLLILDLLLPDGSGTEVLRRLRLQQNKMPVLVLTARGDLETKVENFDAGADDYLTKPFALPELMVRVRALMRRGPAVKDTMLKLADLEVDRLSRQVRRAGKRVELSPKEYSLKTRVSDAECRARPVLPVDDHRPGLGSILRRVHQHRRCLCPAAAPQDRRGVRPEADSHRPRPGLLDRSGTHRRVI